MPKHPYEIFYKAVEKIVEIERDWEEGGRLEEAKASQIEARTLIWALEDDEARHYLTVVPIMKYCIEHDPRLWTLNELEEIRADCRKFLGRSNSPLPQIKGGGKEGL